MTLLFASLNIGLTTAQACGQNAQRKFTAVACGVQQAFERVKVDAMGLVEVGDAEEGLPPHAAAQLVEIIQAQLPDIQLVVHADATGHPYMLLSKAGGNAEVTDVRVVDGFVTPQTWRKALRATLTEADGDVNLWLVHLASSPRRRLGNNVRKQMLSKLESSTPTIIAGDINTPEFMMRHWMHTKGADYSPLVADSGARSVLHGDHTISTNVNMWKASHEVGRSFEDARMQPVDRVSDAHDMVCVVLSGRDAQGKPSKRTKHLSEGGRGRPSSASTALVPGPPRARASDAAELAVDEEGAAEDSMPPTPSSAGHVSEASERPDAGDEDIAAYLAREEGRVPGPSDPSSGAAASEQPC